MKVAIAGAGIGDPTPGLMLHGKGIEVDIFEAIGEIRPLAVGINLLPHASKQLCDLGLEEKPGQERHRDLDTRLLQQVRPGDLA